MEALLEADPKEFSFGTFYVFFLLVFFLSVEVLLETDPNEFDFGNFPYYSYFFFSLNTHRRKSVRIKTRGYGYRSTGQNINGPNINELQINCSIGQQKPVDV